MESLLIERDKPVLHKANLATPLKIVCSSSYVASICFITSYDAHLFHCAYTIAGIYQSNFDVL